MVGIAGREPTDIGWLSSTQSEPDAFSQTGVGFQRVGPGRFSASA
jgi:hypothetical protein